jgi:ribonuclease J
MKICIWRGAKQIGGTCIEIESQGKRLVLDIGQPLGNPDAESVEMPRVEGLKAPDNSLLGVVLSHPHLDHYGLAFRVPPSTRFLMGAATERILEASAIFTPSGGTFENVTHLENGKTLMLGPFKITPYLMDHSAYDSYAVLIEGDGKQIFYTGDLRGHGRKGSLFTRLVAHPPPDVDVLLMEGTTIGRQNIEKGFPTETDLQKEFERIFRTTTGMPLVW